jgi:hypothetical protein
MRHQHQLMQPPQALRRLHPTPPGPRERADRLRLATILQGTACHAEFGGHLPLRLSRRQAHGGRPKLLRPLQGASDVSRPIIHRRPCRAQWHSPRVWVKVHPGRTLEHLPSPSVSSHFQEYELTECSATLPQDFHQAQRTVLAGTMIKAQAHRRADDRWRRAGGIHRSIDGRPGMSISQSIMGRRERLQP